MAKRFKEAGLVDAVPRKIPSKHIHWHADCLLDRLEAEITGVVAIRSPLRLEEALSLALGFIPEPGPSLRASAPRMPKAVPTCSALPTGRLLKQC